MAFESTPRLTNSGEKPEWYGKLIELGPEKPIEPKPKPSVEQVQVDIERRKKLLPPIEMTPDRQSLFEAVQKVVSANVEYVRDPLGKKQEVQRFSKKTSARILSQLPEALANRKETDRARAEKSGLGGFFGKISSWYKKQTPKDRVGIVSGLIGGSLLSILAMIEHGKAPTPGEAPQATRSESTMPTAAPKTPFVLPGTVNTTEDPFSQESRTSFVVKKGDTVWGLVRNYLKQQGYTEGMSWKQINETTYQVVHKIENSSPEAQEEMGLVDGADLIKPGETLDFHSVLDDTASLERIAEHARGLQE